jgi:hypothetical protein
MTVLENVVIGLRGYWFEGKRPRKQAHEIPTLVSWSSWHFGFEQCRSNPKTNRLLIEPLTLNWFDKGGLRLFGVLPKVDFDAFTKGLSLWKPRRVFPIP